MESLDVLDLARAGIWTLIVMSAPVMMIGLIVGLIVALFQALTQIQEMTLAFVPKILVIFVALFLSFPFMGEQLAAYTMQLNGYIVDSGSPAGRP